MQDGDSPRVPRKPPHQNPSVAVSLNKCRQGKGGHRFGRPGEKKGVLWGSSPSSHAERRGGNPGEKRALKKAPLFKRWLKGEDRKKEGIDPIVPYPPPKKRGLHPSSKSPPIPPLAVWVARDRGRVCLAIGTPLFPSPKKSCLEKKE